MRVTVFGATGSVGREVVAQALERGHEVTAFVREPSKVEVEAPNLRVVRGDVMDFASVAGAVEGREAALCSIGAGRKGRVRSEGTKNIVRAMEEAGVRRLVCQSTLGAGESRENLDFFWKHVMFGALLRGAMADHEFQESRVKRSGLDWTIVRPAAFTDGAKTGKYRHGFPPDEKGITLKISRADVANFMLDQLEDDAYLRKTPGLSY